VGFIKVDACFGKTTVGVIESLELSEALSSLVHSIIGVAIGHLTPGLISLVCLVSHIKLLLTRGTAPTT
jgi:hypothetical protein